MPQFAAAALTALTTAGKAVMGAFTGGGAAAGGASAAGLSGGSSFFSGLKLLAGIGGGLTQLAQANAQADETMLQAGQERIQSEQRATAAKRELMMALGDNAATFAAAGIDLSGGIAAANAATLKTRSAEELSIERRNTEMRQAMLRMRAKNIRAAGLSDFGGSLVGGLSQFASSQMSLKV